MKFAEWLLCSLALLIISFLGAGTGQSEELTLQNRAAAASIPPEELIDIYGPLPLPDPPNWLLYLACAAAALGLAALCIYLVRRKKTKGVMQISAQSKALAELDIARRYLEENNSIAYSERASIILRRYIEQRFTISSTTQTTTEFLHSIRENTGQTWAELRSHRQSLKHLLDHFDLAKYAHKTAARELLQEMDASIRRFIMETREEN